MERWLWVRGWVAEKVGARILPPGYVYVDELTFTGRQAVRRVLVGLLGVALGIVAITLLTPESYREVLAGALIAWSTSLVFGANRKFNQKVEDMRREVDRVAKREPIHARLNRLDHALSIETDRYSMDVIGPVPEGYL